MSLSGAAWSSDLMGRFSAVGFTGTELGNFTSAVGNGSANHIIGLAFVTADVGTLLGAGAGTGVGIVGLSAETISSNIYGLAVGAFGQAGSRLKDFCDAIAAACVSQLSRATLVSVNSPVFLGAATIVVGSITVSGSGWGSLIQSSAPGFSGSQWPSFSNAIGQGQAMAVKASGTGSLVIAGPGFPTSSGVGAGTGTIS